MLSCLLKLLHPLGQQPKGSFVFASNARSLTPSASSAISVFTIFLASVYVFEVDERSILFHPVEGLPASALLPICGLALKYISNKIFNYTCYAASSRTRRKFPTSLAFYRQRLVLTELRLTCWLYQPANIFPHLKVKDCTPALAIAM